MTTKPEIILIFAPHLNYPLRNGADIYIDGLACHLSLYRDSILILGTKTLTHYKNGAIHSQSRFSNNLRTKSLAAIRTLAFNSHYLVEKFLTTVYRKKAKELIQKNPKSLVIYSFITTASLELKNELAVVITHNDEVSIYGNQQLITKNPLHKMTAAFSAKWLLNFLRHSSKKYIYAHITEADQNAYSNYVSQHKSILVPGGVEYRSSLVFTPLSHRKINLLFCGSLNVKMNLDALLFFKEKFWILLKNHLQEDIDLWVAGSQPTSSIINLCKIQGWAFYPDISDDELNLMYANATFGILPFEYSAGAKIKLLNSLAAGLPVLATNNVKTMPEQDFPPNLFSNDPNKWLDHLKKYRELDNNDILSGRIACQQFAGQFSWQKIAENMDRDLKALGV